MDNIIKEKNTILSKTPKSYLTQYISIYDDIAKLNISKNRLLLELDRVDEIDMNKTCNFALNYQEIEFIKTEYYKTPFHDEVAKTLQNIASLYEQCHPPMAEKYLRSILAIKEYIYLKNSAEVARAHDGLGDYFNIYMANFKKSIKEYEEAKRIREKLYKADDIRITENYERLSKALYYNGDKTNKAEELLLKAIKLREKSPTKNYPLYIAYMDIGIYYSMKDEYDKSINYLQKSLKLYKGKVNINYIIIISELSQNYLNQDDLNNALRYAQKAYITSKEFYRSNVHYQVLENFTRLTEIKNRINN